MNSYPYLRDLAIGGAAVTSVEPLFALDKLQRLTARSLTLPKEELAQLRASIPNLDIKNP